MSTKGIAKYYIGLGVLMLFVIVTLIYTVSQAGAAKTDRETNKTVEQLTTKLEGKIADTGQVPLSLEAAGVTNPASTVVYTKLSDTKYKVCIDYKTASSGFDAGWFSLLGGGFSTPYQYQSDHTYFDSTVEFNHKKGQNCQTITSNSIYSGSQYNGGALNFNKYGSADSACENPPQGLLGGDLTVSRVDTASKTIYFDSTNQFVYDNNGNAVPTISSKQYNDNTIFCNGQDLSLTTAAAVKAGSQVTVYLKSASDSTLYQVDTTYLIQ